VAQCRSNDSPNMPLTPLTVLWRDEYLVAIHKPSGLLVHRTAIDRHERRFAVQLLRDQLGQRVYPVHRLDKGTSGALLFGLDRDTTRTLATAFANSAVSKRYLAVVRGWPDERGSIATPLDPVQDDVDPAGGGARPALTHFERVATCKLAHRVDRYPTSRYALVELEPVTGRRHQLRRHLARISHPIIGDSTYGKGAHNRLFARLFGSQRLLLACTSLSLTHPVTGVALSIAAPPSEDFVAVTQAAGLSR